MFGYTIKYHYMLHIGKMCHYMNPALGWCYAGEDFMHHIKTVVRSCSAGSPPHLAVRKIIEKYVRGFGLSLVPPDALWRP